MNVSCPHCQAKYVIADEKIRGRSRSVTCKRCTKAFTVEAPPWDDEVTLTFTDVTAAKLKEAASALEVPWSDRAIQVPPDARLSGDLIAQWYVVIRGEQLGPIAYASVVERVKTGDIKPSSYLWKEGMADWKKMSELVEFQALLENPPRGVSAPALVRELQQSSASQDVPLGADGPRPQRKTDPFSKVYDTQPSMVTPMGEATRFFMLKAGVNRKTPVWKIGVMAVSGLVLLVGLLYALSSLNVVPLRVTTIDETGREVKESVFSSKGLSALADQLTGKNRRQTPKVEPAATPVAEKTASKPLVALKEPSKPKAPLSAGEKEDLAALYADTSKSNLGPKVRQDVEEKGKDSDSDGLSAELVKPVVTASQPAFAQCIEQELRRNPNFKGGRTNITVVVAPSGIVTKASIDRREVELSSLGECLNSRAKKMVFPSFSGNVETEVQIPLILGSTL